VAFDVVPGKRLTPSGRGRYSARVKRLELGRIRVCDRCGRGAAELRGADGEKLVVTLDPVRARQLAGPEERCLTDVVLERFAATGAEVSEVVLDVIDGRLGALVSLVGEREPEVVACTAEEAVALFVRGAVKLYATDDALAHGTARSTSPTRPDTIH
jgi:hypothetical protein